MNVRLPFGEHRLGFGIILIIMVSLLGVMLFYFRKKKWL